MNKIIIERNSYSGVKWKIFEPIDYDDIIFLITETIKDKYFIEHNKATKTRIQSLLTCNKLDIITYLDLLQNDTHKTVDIKCNSYGRFIIYNLCAILGLKCELLKENTRKYIGCNEYYPFKTRRLTCGCDYAPNNFWKYHVTNNYDDDIAYSSMPWTEKLGIRIIK